MIYLAPMQGYSEVFYRKALFDSIGGINKYYTPFFEFGYNKPIEWPNRWELSSTLNAGQNLVPQLVAKDAEELITGAKFFIEHGFKEINLNLGCPFPMLVKRQRGCGALPHPEATSLMLETFFAQELPITLSIKTRLGLNNTSELPNLLPLINHLPIKELIIHFRLGIDQYKGEVRWDEMEPIKASTHFNIVGNGDILSPQEFDVLQTKFPLITDWMIGRGILINPLLAQEINGLKPTWDERIENYKSMHKRLMELMIEENVEENRFMNTMKSFWQYHSQFYDGGRKINKEIAKTKNSLTYNALVANIWKSSLSPAFKIS